MSGEIVEPEVLGLPADFESLPYDLRARAFAWARGAVPTAMARFGAEIYDDVLANAAAHWLLISDQAGTDDDAARRPLIGTSNSGTWAGSVYGELVATSLTRLPRVSGRGRRHLGPI